MKKDKKDKQEKKSREEIDKMWADYKATHNEKLRDEIITNYLYLVKHVVGRLIVGLPQHVNIEDMYSTGIMGLIKAVERFDPTMKNKFETYAILLVKGAVIDEMRALDWVPRSIHQKANWISKAQIELQQELGREATDGELAKYLGLSIDALQDLMVRVRPAVLISLDVNASDNDEDNTTMADRIPDDKSKTSYEVADRNEFSTLLRRAVLDLPEQERMVLVLYYYENLMLKEIGQVMDVSESRVSQIHTKAVMRLRQRLKEFISEFSNIL